jgi:hypothetical protein
MEFKCSVCNYTSKYKIDIDRHINKQKKCGENPKIVETLLEIKCDYCDKFYKTTDTLKKHLKICKVKKSNMEEENIRLKEELKEANKKLANNGNININNTTNITNNYLVQLRSYNNPKLPEDMDDIYEDAWEKQKSIQTYIERVHFNVELPENHNMCITNLRTKLAAKVFTGENWETKDQNKILDEIIDNTNNLLDKWVKTNKKRREKYEGAFIEYMEGKSKNKINEETKNELKLLLYDSYKNGIVDIKSVSKQPYISYD